MTLAHPRASRTPARLIHAAGQQAPALLAVALLLVTAVAALRFPGLSARSVDPDSGTAWLLRGGTSQPLVVNINGLTMEATVERELDKSSATDALDIHQNGAVALLQQARRLRPIDMVAGALASDGFALPDEADQVQLRGDTIAAWSVDRGQLWLAATQDLGPGSSPFGSPLELGGPIQVEVAPDGDTWTLDPATGVLGRFAGDSPDPITSATVAVPPGETPRLTASDELAVVVTDSQLFVIDHDGRITTRNLSWDGMTPGFVNLQEPGDLAPLLDGTSPVVVAGAPSGLVAIDTSTGAVRPLVEVPFGVRAEVRPIVAGACAYGLGQNVFLQACVGASGTSQTSDGTMSRPRLRLVRGLVYFEDWPNDVVGVWQPETREPRPVTRPETADQADEEACGTEPDCSQGDTDAPGQGDSGAQAVGPAERGVNDGLDQPPQAVDDEVTLVIGRTSVVDLLANDIQSGDGPLWVLPGPLPPGLVVTHLPDRRVAISADPGISGPLTFTYQATDGRAVSESATVTVTIVASATPSPELEPDLLEAVVDVRADLDVLFNDRDRSGQTLTLAGLDVPPSFSGVAAFLPTGQVSVQPTAADVGTHTFGYEVVVPGGGSARSQLTIQVSAEGPADPQPTSDFVRLQSGASASIDLLANDRDPNGRALVIDGPLRQLNPTSSLYVSPLQGGTVWLSASPGLTETQSAVFAYTVSNGLGSTEALLRVDIDPVPATGRPPLAIDDHLVLRAGSAGRVEPLANDIELDRGDVIGLTGELTTSDSRLAVRRLSTSAFEVTADPSLPAGLYAVDYVISDFSGGKATGTVHVLVQDPTAANRRPTVADGRTFDIEPGAELVVRVGEAPLANDPDGDPLAVSGVSSSSPDAGVDLRVSSTQSTIRVTTAPSSLGSFTVTYVVGDGRGLSAPGWFTVRITPNSNKPPVALDDRFLAASGVETRLAVLSGDAVGRGADFDPEGGPISIHSFDDANLVGSVQLAADGTSFTYRAPPDYGGVTELTYRVRDAQGTVSESATVAIRVEPRPTQNSPPVANPDQVTLTVQDGAKRVQILANDTDPDTGDAGQLVVDGTELADSRFQPVVNGQGDTVDLVFTPALADAGQTFSTRYRVRDPIGAMSEPATVMVTVAPIAANPQLSAGSTGIQEVARGQAAKPVDVVALAHYDGPDRIGVEVTGGGGQLADGRLVTFVAGSGDSATVTYVLTAGNLRSQGSIQYRIVDDADPPAGNPDGGYRLRTGQTLVIPVADLLANDRDSRGVLGPGGSSLVVAGVDPQPALNPSLSGGKVTVTGGAVGTQRFRYTLRDSSTGLTASATVTVEVSDGSRTLQDVSIGIGSFAPQVETQVDLLALVATDDPAGLTFGRPSVAGTGGATATISGARLQITTGDVGDVTIRVPVSDGSSEATVSIGLRVATLELPVVPPRTLTLLAGQQSASIRLLDRTGGTSASVDPIAGGSLDATTGVYTYTRQGAEPPTLTVTYQVENSAGTASGLLTIEIARDSRLIDAVPVPLTLGAGENTVSTNLRLGGTAVVLQSDSVRLTGAGITSFGTLDGATGNYTYRRQSTGAGSVTFSYAILNADGLPGASAPVTVTIEAGGTVEIRPPTNIRCSSTSIFVGQDVQVTSRWTWDDASFGESSYVVNTASVGVPSGQPAREVDLGPDAAGYSLSTISDVMEVLTHITVRSPSGPNLVVSVNSAATCQSTQTSSFTTPIEPTIAAGDGQATVSWTPSADATVTYYEIQVSSSTLNQTYRATTSPFTITGLPNGENFVVHFRACRADDTCGPQASNSAYSAAPGAPGPPIGLTASSPQPGQLSVVWSPPSSTGSAPIDHYDLDHGGSTPGYYDRHETVRVTSFELDGISGPRHVRVRACNSVGCGPYAETPSIQVGTTGSNLGNVLSAAATSGEDQSSTVSWEPPVTDASSPIQYYRVEVLELGGTYATDQVTVQMIQVPNGTSTVVRGLTNGKAYRFRVAACNATGCGGSAGTQEISPGAAGVPAPPAGVVADSTGKSGEIRVKWGLLSVGGIGQATRTEIEVTGRGIEVASSATEHVVVGLTNGVSYEVKVRACSAAGCGLWSNAKAPARPYVALVPDTPGDIQALVTPSPGGNGGAVTITWLPRPAPSGYPGGRHISLEMEGGFLTYIETAQFGLREGKQYSSLPPGSYRFRVQACDDLAGCSPWTGWTAAVVVPGPTDSSTTTSTSLPSTTPTASTSTSTSLTSASTTSTSTTTTSTTTASTNSTSSTQPTITQPTPSSLTAAT